jgi:hypothetical protein
MTFCPKVQFPNILVCLSADMHCVSNFKIFMLYYTEHTNTGMHRTTTFRSTKDRIYHGGPIILLVKYIIIMYCVTVADRIQYSDMLYSL